MSSRKISKTLLIAAVIFIIGAAVAFAQGGWGRGHMMKGDGYGHEYCPNYRGYGANLTDEQKAQVDAARERFFQQTEALRNEIMEKRIELNEAIGAKAGADEVIKLQRELSTLRSQFDEQAVQHRLEMRNLLPEDAYEGAKGRMKGPGRGYGGGMRQ